MAKGGSVYMMCNINNTVIYTGVCGDLVARVSQHKSKTAPTSFTAKYNCVKLVYYRFFETIESAIEEEKRIKGGNRKQKERRINSVNPEWRDLWEDIKNW
ncbi:MAG: GIY-YIG nuclease family protein [Chitinophagaceae bacterium]|nr:GIY-YIG nuclease family protein [Chitinophagaceae bacterium]